MRLRSPRRIALVVAVLVPAWFAGGGLPVATPDAAGSLVSARGATTARTTYSFAVAADVFNQDIGDVRGKRGWDPGDPNSWTPRLGEAVDTVLGEIASHQPESLLIPGDLVQGHWGRDDMKTGIFGPTRTNRQRTANLRRAGNFYHSQNAAELASHGLTTVHAALGDHDIGDNPWGGPDRRVRFKRDSIGVFRSLFARHYNLTPNGRQRYHHRPAGSQWARTAYAVRLDPDVLLVTLDEFHRVGKRVRTEVVGAQLTWLERTLASARRQHIRWVVVQGHVPVLTPVRARSSSRLSLDRGRRSPLWRTMARGGVDLYLCGEVHDTSMRRANGVTQVASGTPIYLGKASYLTADVRGDRMDLVAHEFAGDVPWPRQHIWQGSNEKTAGNVIYPSPSSVVGTLTLTAGGRTAGATGKLAPYGGRR